MLGLYTRNRTHAQKGPGLKIAGATLSSNSVRQTVYTNCTSVHQAAKLAAALLRVARVTAGLAESNGSLPPGLCLCENLVGIDSAVTDLRMREKHGLYGFLY